MSSLDAATSIEPRGPGRYDAHLDPDWWLDGTAFGGYLAALLQRAAGAARPGAGQLALSTSVQFTAAVRPGPARVQVEVVPAGAAASAVLATLRQGTTVHAVALCAFGAARPGPDVCPAAPDLPGPAECPELTVRPQVRDRFPMAARFERRRLPADRLPGGTGGWVRLAEPRPPDLLAALVYLDSWTAALGARVPIRRMLTISYFVQYLRPSAADPHDHLLATFSCDCAHAGYAEDVGELRDAAGVVLARSRQVILVS